MFIYRNINRIFYPTAKILVLLLSFLQFGNSSFAQSGFGITGAAEYTENPLRVNDPQDSDVLMLLRVDGNLARETQRFNALFNYRASSLDYKNDLLKDRKLIEGSSTLIWKVMPEVLQWSLSNSRSNEIISANEPDIIDNRQIISSTTTGPALTLPIGAANLLNLQMSYSVVGYEQTDFLDQKRKSVSADFSRNLSARVTASLRSSLMESDFDSGTVSKYKIASYSANGSIVDSTYTASLELGKYHTKRTGMASSSNPLVKLSGAYQINSTSEFSVNYSRTVEDLLSDVRSSQLGVDPEAGLAAEMDFESRIGSSSFAGVYVKKTANVGYSYTDRSRFNLALDYTKDERDSEQAFRNQIDERYSANFMLPVSARLDLTLRARYSELEFSALDPTQKRTELTVSTLYRFNDRLSLNFSLRNTDQKSDSVLDTYDGVNIFLGVTYRR